MERRSLNLSVRVLVYPEGGGVIAHGLEMDLLGYGADEPAAKADLVRQIESQIFFAASKIDPGMIYFPAPADLFRRWESARKQQLRGMRDSLMPDRGDDSFLNPMHRGGIPGFGVEKAL